MASRTRTVDGDCRETVEHLDASCGLQERLEHRHGGNGKDGIGAVEQGESGIERAGVADSFEGVKRGDPGVGRRLCGRDHGEEPWNGSLADDSEASRCAFPRQDTV